MIFDTLENLETYIPVVPQLRTIADAMDHDNIYDLGKGHYTTPDTNVVYDVSEYSSSPSDKPFVYHKNHTIVEIVLSGSELMSTTWRELKDEAIAYDKKTDTGFFTAEPLSVVQAAQGRFVVFLPGEPYKSGISQNEGEIVKKVVFSVTEI